MNPHVVDVRSPKYVFEPYLQLVGYQYFQAHECLRELKDVLPVLVSFRLSNIITTGIMNLLQPLNTEIHKLLVVCVQHSIAI